MTQMTPEQVFTIAVIGGATVGAVLLLTAALALSLYLGTWRAARADDRYETAGTASDDQDDRDDRDVRDWFDGTRRAIEALPTTDHPTED